LNTVDHLGRVGRCALQHFVKAHAQV
jgi:hypothetical protein